MTKPKKQPLGQTIGGVLFGFEQQVLRTTPPPQELVRHARPDGPVAAGDGTLVTIELPSGVALPADDRGAGADDPKAGGRAAAVPAAAVPAAAVPADGARVAPTPGEEGSGG